MASLHAFLSPSPTLGGESSSQGTFSERLSQQSTTASSSSQSQPSQSQSQGQASAQTAPTQPKRVRLAVNGLQAVPGFSDPAIGDDDAEPTDVDAPPPPVKRKRGRPRVFDPAEVDMRRRERNRQAAASHRLTQRNQLGLLEREITQLAEKVGSLET
jgi:hypothetical protein